MIVQEINLYQERFKEKVVALSARQLLSIFTISLCVVGYLTFWYGDQHQQAATENQRLVAQKEQAEKVLSAIQSKLETILANNQFDIQLKKVSRDISVRKHMINFVSKNQFGSGKGFSNRLDMLSQFSMPDVWLSEIKLSDDYMKFSGSALREENVPEYFNQFKKQEMFKGRKFDVFEMQRPAERDWKVDFVIASRVEE